MNERNLEHDQIAKKKGGGEETNKRKKEKEIQATNIPENNSKRKTRTRKKTKNENRRKSENNLACFPRSCDLLPPPGGSTAH